MSKLVGVYPFVLGKKSVKKPEFKTMVVKIVGFSGSQKGMTQRQLQTAKNVISILSRNYSVFSHGDCIGADAQAHKIARANGFAIVIHPPINQSKRAFKKADLVKQAKEYLDRNKEIVISSTVMVATPDSKVEKLRSGTWSAIRLAKRLKKPIYIIFPDGSMKLEVGQIKPSRTQVTKPLTDGLERARLVAASSRRKQRHDEADRR